MKPPYLRCLFSVLSFGLATLAAAQSYESWGPYHGMNVGPRITEQDIADLAKTKATLVRASFGEIPFVNKTPPYAFNEEAFARLRNIVDWCEKYGLKVVIDPHTTPGLRRPWTCEFEDLFWQDKQWHEYLIQTWRRIATEYKDRGEVIAGYDLLNEPATPAGLPEGPSDWNHLVAALVRTIRDTGDRHTIIVEPTATRGPTGEYINRQQSLPFLRLPADPRIVVSPHTYQPHAFTHQGAEGHAVGVRYPGVVDGKQWDREALRASLQVIRRFQEEHKVPIFIGEFSASRFAGPDGEAYLNDLISLFDEYGWSWTYHDYRTSREWDPEMTTPDFQETSRDPQTPRMRLLSRFFSTHAGEE